MMLKQALKKILPPTISMVDVRHESLLREIDQLKDELHSVHAELVRHASLKQPSDNHTRKTAEGGGEHRVIVSLASYGPRIPTIGPMLESLRDQDAQADKIYLWVPAHDFPRRYLDFPSDVLHAISEANVEVRWTTIDLGPHNKYFWTMQEHPNDIVITLDDDVRYPSNLLKTLLEAHKEHPTGIISTRTHRIRFNDQGEPAPYADWELEQNGILDRGELRLFATGLGGILYPPGSISPRAFDIEAIRKTCPTADDLWLKVMSALVGTTVVNPNYSFIPDYIEGTQEHALCNENLWAGANDGQLKAILEHLDTFFSAKKFLEKLKG